MDFKLAFQYKSAIKLHTQGMNTYIQHIVSFHNAKGKTIGLCHGCFDLLHAGHVLHFKYAKSKVDILLVSITGSHFVTKAKGSIRPLFSDGDRLQIVGSIRFVDYAFIHNEADATSLLRELPIDYYFKGPDYNVESKHMGLQQEIKALQPRTKIVFTPTLKHSSSEYINEIMNISQN